MLILDSHTFLWLRHETKRLKPGAVRALEAHEGPLWLSMASIWEIEIKQANGKLDFVEIDWSSPQLSQWLTIIDIALEDTLLAARLPLLHRDPFDRMIVAQALNRKAAVVTRDDMFRDYGVKVVMS